MLTLIEVVKFIRNNKQSIIAGDRQTGKTTLAAELIEAALSANPSMKILYVAANTNMTDYLKRLLPSNVIKNISIINYQYPDNISRGVIGREYDLVVVDAYGEPDPDDINDILNTANKEHSRVIFFTDISTVRTSRIGHFPTIAIGSKQL